MYIGVILWTAIFSVPAQAAFSHPGLLHSQQQLDFIKSKVEAGEQPWLSGYEQLCKHPQSSYSYVVKGGFARVGRGSRQGDNMHKNEFDADCNAAHYNALMWCLTGDRRHADKAKEILNAYSSTLGEIVGTDKILMASLNGAKLVYAAELIRHTDAGWDAADIDRFERMLLEVFYPVIRDFAVFANGNWSTGCVKTTMAIGVFCDNQEIFDRAVNWYRQGTDNGSLTNYIINENGQCQESGRDQQHAQLGLAHLAEVCEMAWNQGLDLYGASDNRLLKGFEYTAQYNLGCEVPFVPWRDTTGKYYHTTISDDGRGRLRPIWEMVYNHYQNRKGMDCPYTRQAAEKVRPEAAGPNADCCGFGTLLFSRDPRHAQLDGNDAMLLCRTPARCQSDSRAESPDGQVVVQFKLQSGGIPTYRIDYLGKPLILESRMGFQGGFNQNFEIIDIAISAHEGHWINAFGERRIVPDNYHELVVHLKHDSGCLMQILFRAYNEGAAFRYFFPNQEKQTVVFPDEKTEFRLPEETWGYEAQGTEGEYQRSKIADIKPYCERPLTLEYADGLWASLAEAATMDYPRMLLSPLDGVPGALVSALGGRTSNTSRPSQRHDSTVTLKAGQGTPWRMLVTGKRPGDLLERNYLMLNLNPPCVLKDTSWIKPGKVMRDTTLTTANSKAIIDFAAVGGLQYVLLDAGWYGSEDTKNGDATTARKEALDIPEIIRYGRQKNVGLIVYVDRRQIKTQRDILFLLYEKWGVKGVKIGFIDVGPQQESLWTTETIARAADHHLMLNIHDGYRATGNNRTYPNLMTVEGIRGNEHMPTPEHNCTLPFTRYVAGIGDYTICYYDSRLKTTHAHQLAMAVVSFSPLQWIYWYDKPAMYRDEPEVEFFRHVPTVWDETKVIGGEIGKFAIIARRSGDQWFIGTINNSQPRQVQIPLDFLDKDRKYTASIYSDDQAVQTKTKVGIDKRPVDSRTVLDVPLLAGGGQAVWIQPAQ